MADFVLPSTDGMSKDDQFVLLVNQAAVHLVTRYLQHSEFAAEHGHADTLYGEEEFLDLIDRIQERLRAF